MVGIEFEKIDSRIVVRFMNEYKSEVLQRSYITSDLIIIVPEAHLDDIKEDFEIYSSLPGQEQRNFLGNLRTLPRYTGRMQQQQNSTS